MAKNLSAKEMTALVHWSSYGQRGMPPGNRVKASQWKTHPFKIPVSSSWSVPISPNQLPSLLMGFLPHEMEDKWFVYADGPNDEGHIVVHFFRSWTGMKIAEVPIEKDVSEGAQEDYMRITGIIWESSEDVMTWQVPGDGEAKEMVREVCRWVLNVELLDDEAK